jgi:putative sigma-54 modulation protein
MRIDICCTSYRLSESEVEAMRRRIGFALNRFVHRIMSVTVGLVDINGPRGGPDKRCRFIVTLARHPRVIIEQSHARASAAVALAADRTSQVVSKLLSRRRKRKAADWTLDSFPIHRS